MTRRNVAVRWGEEPMEHTMRQILALAALLSAIAMTAPAASAAGSGKFCLNGPGTTSTCSYQTMAACEKAKKGEQPCAANASGTTGAGMNNSQSQTSPVGNDRGGSMKK